MSLVDSAVRGLYSAVVWAMQPLLRRKLARRGVQEPGYLEAIEERFGHYGDGPAPGQGWIWVHAVSMGETRAAAILVRALRRQMPGMRLLLTHGTATGRAEGKALLQPGDMQVWQPWDTPAAVGRFLARFRPAIGILMGIGFYMPAILATVLTLSTLSIFRWIEARMPAHFYAHHFVRFARNEVMPEPQFKAFLAEHGFTLANMSQRLTDDGLFYEYRMVIRTHNTQNLSKIAVTLRQMPSVRAFGISPTGD